MRMASKGADELPPTLSPLLVHSKRSVYVRQPVPKVAEQVPNILIAVCVSRGSADICAFIRQMSTQMTCIYIKGI
jgi:hypothetical protein